MSDDLSDIMADMLKIQGDMAAKLVEHRGHIVAVEFAVLAVIEQLSASGLVNSRQAADRLIELSKTIDHKRFLEKIEPQINATASLLRSLGEPKDPRPPRGSKPHIVK